MVIDHMILLCHSVIASTLSNKYMVVMLLGMSLL